MPATLALFDFTGQKIRGGEVDGQPVLVGKDVCDALGIVKYRDALAQLDEDERVSITVDTPGGPQTMTAVTEGGIWSLAFISRSPQVKTFRRWVTHTVLPEIRKTGSFGVTSPAQITRADLARMVLAAEEELAVVSAALKSAEPAIAYHDRFVLTDDVVQIKVWGAQFGLTQPQAFDLLVDKRAIYRHSLGERWSGTKGRREQVWEYRARAGRPSFLWFDLRPQHNAPRHHNGQVRQTLYIRQGNALDLAKLAGLTAANTLAVSA
jgi:prophage antirepressor-like protein